jgi:predicted methyltransferase
MATSVGLNAAPLTSLDIVLAAQNESKKARYTFLNPNQTLAFFGIKPGMKVAEGLPGGGWYSKILLSYLGGEGELVGVDYPLDIWQHFSFASEEYIEAKESWAKSWTNQAKGWGVASSAKISAYTFAILPEALNGQLDAVLLIRMLHNLACHEDKGRYLDDALATTFRVLKQGGIVQHHAREDRSDG